VTAPSIYNVPTVRSTEADLSCDTDLSFDTIG
jgi:hypothetical protein